MPMSMEGRVEVVEIRTTNLRKRIEALEDTEGLAAVSTITAGGRIAVSESLAPTHLIFARCQCGNEYKLRIHGKGEWRIVADIVLVCQKCSKSFIMGKVVVASEIEEAAQ